MLLSRDYKYSSNSNHDVKLLMQGFLLYCRHLANPDDMRSQSKRTDLSSTVNNLRSLCPSDTFVVRVLGFTVSELVN